MWWKNRFVQGYDQDTSEFLTLALGRAKSRPVHLYIQDIPAGKTLNVHGWGVTISLSTQCGTTETRKRGFLTLRSIFFIAEGEGGYAAGYNWGSSGRLCASQFGVCWDSPLAAFTHSSNRLAVHVNIKEGWETEEGGCWQRREREWERARWWVGEAERGDGLVCQAVRLCSGHLDLFSRCKWRSELPTFAISHLPWLMYII